MYMYLFLCELIVFFDTVREANDRRGAGKDRGGLEKTVRRVDRAW